jgi:hypothetical protein
MVIAFGRMVADGRAELLQSTFKPRVGERLLKVGNTEQMTRTNCNQPFGEPVADRSALRFGHESQNAGT